MAFGSRPVWAGEKLMIIFSIWSRWATFTRCKRSGTPLPQYSQPLPQWDIWVYNHQERQVRKVKAAAKAPLARMRRFFQCLRRFSDRSIEKRGQTQRATQHYVQKITREILLSWREEIAEDAYNKKLCRHVIAKLHDYARVKAALRPRKQAVVRRKQLWDFGCAWRAWKGVHLRSFFKRELNVSKLEQSQWRSKVHRIIYIWMDAKHQVNRWRTFEAWRNLCRKRRLFQTLRFHCERIRRRHLLSGILNAWKASVWKQEDEFLEDRLKLSAWDAYEELSPFFPMLFFGSYSAAATIFGGVEMKSEDGEEEKDTKRLPYDSDGIRRFQSALTQGSVAEARNTVLQSKHLINAVDDASGNTPLHVVMQVEDPMHRIDMLSLLLSEGAATWHHSNRHGLTPKQLAPDEDTTLLLDKGIYAFYANKVLRLNNAARMKAKEEENAVAINDTQATAGSDQRLMWCIVTLMSSEWVRGLRFAGDIKIREWHSVLKEELWLRQERIIFASKSEFSPAILRCRAFLNGMKKKLARSCDQILEQQVRKAILTLFSSSPSEMQQQDDDLKPLPVRKSLSRALHSRGSMRGQHVSMLTRIVDQNNSEKSDKAAQDENDRIFRAKMLGDLEPYARFLLTPTLDCELAEKALVHSFVGALFSLEFSVNEVLKEAFRLEDMCLSLEQTVLDLHESLVRAQWKVASFSSAPSDSSLLCCFASELEMDLHFSKEIFLLHLAGYMLYCKKKNESAEADRDVGAGQGQGSPGLAPAEIGDDKQFQQRETFAKEASGLATRLQRKMRKIEKKKKSLEDHLAESASNYRAKFFTAARSVHEISEARMVIERARLRMAAVLLKHSELQSDIAAIDDIKQRLVSGEDLSQLPVKAYGYSADEITHRRIFLEAEFVRCTQSYRTKELFGDGDNSTATGTTATDSNASLEVRRLYKEAKAALRLLFVVNLFRCCCCWLAENMIPPPAAAPEASSEDKKEEKCTLAERQDLPKAHALKREPILAKRRSNMASTRKLAETLHRASVLAETAECDAVVMLESYASSAGLLFEKERTDLVELEKQKNQEQSQVVQIIRELNPLTGQPEEPPEHLLDQERTSSNSTKPDSEGGEKSTFQVPVRNRKRDELRKAIVEHQLKRIATADMHMSESERARDDALLEEESTVTHSQLPSIHGASVEFGNFVVGGQPHMSGELVVLGEEGSAIAANTLRNSVDSMWKRGARANEGAASSSKTSSDIFTSVEDEVAFNASFHVLSASREKRSTLSRISSAGKMPNTPESLPSRHVSEQRNGSAREAKPHESRVVQISAAAAPDYDQSRLKEYRTSDDSGTLTDEADQATMVSFGLDENAAGQIEETESVTPQSNTICENENGQRGSKDVSSIPEQRSLATGRYLDTGDSVPLPGSLEEHLENTRKGVAQSANDSMPALPASGTIPNSEKTQRHYRGRSLYGDTDDNDNALAGSRFLSFIKWEKKESTAPETISHLPHIFQDSPARISSYSQEERDVRQTQLIKKKERKKKKKALTMKKQADMSAIAAPVTQSESSLFIMTSGSSTSLSLHGKSAVLTGSRKKAAVDTSGDDGQGVSALDADTSQEEVDGLKTLSAIPRIFVTVVQPRTSEVSESPSEFGVLPCHVLEKPAGGISSTQPHCESDLLHLEGRGVAQRGPVSMETAVELRTRGDQEVKGARKQQPSRKAANWPFQGPQRQVSSSLPRQRSNASLTRLQLDGASVRSSTGGTIAKSQSTADVKKKKEESKALPVELSKQQKQQVWDEFASLSLSEGVQNAYSVLYPHIYEPASTTKPVSSQARQDANVETESERNGAPSAVQEHLSPPQKASIGSHKQDADCQYTNALQLRSLTGLHRSPTSQISVELDKKFWSAVEGYKAIGASASVLLLDAKAHQARRKEIASRIHDEFLHDRSHRRLDWVDMYPDEVRSVVTQLNAAPKNLFNTLQQTAQLRISTAMAQRHAS